MNAKDRMILEEFKEQRDCFLKLEEIAVEQINQVVAESKVFIAGVEHRVKGEDSLAKKLYKKGDSYQSLSDLTDLLGARIICFFVDDVNVIGKAIEQTFEIDWQNSVDKRNYAVANSFGYLSLHYICSLKKDQGYPEELTNKKFEIQIRSILQHAWAAINHDLGYKNDFGVPREVVRELARLAGLLELADNEFARTRDHIKDYTEDIRQKIVSDSASDVNIDIVSLKEYMLGSKKMQAFLSKLAKIEKSEITYSEPDNYIKQLKWFGIETLGGLQDMLESCKEVAVKLANKALKGSELDILSSNVALRFLCQAKLISGGYTKEQAVEFLRLSIKDLARAERQVNRLFNLKKELKIND